MMESGADKNDVAPASTARRDVLHGLRQGAVIGAVVLAVLLPFYGSKLWRSKTAPPPPAPAIAAVQPKPAPQVAAAPAIERQLDFGDVRAPTDVTQVAGWAVREADNGVLPFAIIDKRRAQVYVFAATGKLLGTSPVLLGYAAGDHTVEGIGNKAIADIKPSERTTPAGRFVSQVGRNALHEDVVWVDYEAAVSMHRVRVTNPAERRLERLATPTPADNRISWGCVNVPVAFFEQTVWPQFRGGRAVVYVLPEKEPLVAFFPAAAATQVLAQAGAPAPRNSARP